MALLCNGGLFGGTNVWLVIYWWSKRVPADIVWGLVACGVISLSPRINYEFLSKWLNLTKVAARCCGTRWNRVFSAIKWLIGRRKTTFPGIFSSLRQVSYYCFYKRRRVNTLKNHMNSELWMSNISYLHSISQCFRHLSYMRSFVQQTYLRSLKGKIFHDKNEWLPKKGSVFR